MDYIVKAYRFVLDREPDAAGYEFYKNKNLSYERLCEVLRQSREFEKKFSKDEAVKNIYSSLTWPLGQIFIVSNLKLLYCPIAKNACSSLKRLMVQLSDIENKELILEGDIHINTDSANTGIQLKDYDELTAKKILTSDDYFKFAVLRDPFSRLLSAYWEKFVVNRARERNLIHTGPVIQYIQERKGKKNIDPNIGISFSNFLDYILNSNPYELDPHWKPQYTYLEEVNFNKFYDQSRMDVFYRDLSDRCGKEIFAESRNVTNSGSGTEVTGASHLLPLEIEKYGNIAKSSFFDSSVKRKINEYFSKDFELLELCER